MSRNIEYQSTYAEKLVKLIPAEIVAAYLAIQNLVLTKPEIREVALYVSAGILAAMIPFYLKAIHDVTSWLQISMTVVSFLVWAFSVSVLFLKKIDVDPVWGSVILILWTTAIPVMQFNKKDDEP